LPNAVKHLEDKELDQLLSAVIAEQKRRGKKLPAGRSFDTGKVKRRSRGF
jgi:hypothetical protein